MIKLVAAVLMAIDHIGLVFFPNSIYWRLIGRLSMPLFAYSIARGYRHSRENKTLNRYLFNMFVFAVISQIPYYLVAGEGTNIGFTWAFSLLLLMNLDRAEKSRPRAILACLAVLAAALVIFTGCADLNGAARDSTEETIKRKLYERYGQTFSVKKIEQVSSQTTFSKYMYYATVYLNDSTKVFHATMSKDGKSFTDDYPRILFEEKMNDEIESILILCEFIEAYSYKIIFQESAFVWQKEEDYEDYLKDSGTYVSVKVSIDASDMEEAVQRGYELALSMKEEAFQFCMEISFAEEKIVIESRKEKTMPLYEELLRKYVQNCYESGRIKRESG